jgi:hypothetical protein
VLAVVDDVDGDGLQDVLAGAPYADVGSVVDAGRAVVLSVGQGTVLAALHNDVDATSNRFGSFVAGLGDVSGDGLPELMVGAPYDDVGSAIDGGSFAVFALETECDDDGVTPFGGDCDDGNADLWRLPDEVRELRFAADHTSLTWSAPDEPGTDSGTLVYDTLRSGVASGFDRATCVETDGGDTSTLDGDEPDPGALFFYLVRAANDCGDGELGRWGVEAWPRVGPVCDADRSRSFPSDTDPF